MDSGMIGKVAKAHRYAEEQERFRFTQLEVTVHGENSDHTVSLDGEHWHCTCEFFQLRQTCAHSMALEIMLEKMLPRPVSSASFAMAS
jgi:hypothetical protein